MKHIFIPIVVLIVMKINSSLTISMKENRYPYLVSINYKTKEEQAPHLVDYLLTTDNKTSNYITVSDILEVTHAENMTYKDFKMMPIPLFSLKYMDAKKIEDIFKTLNVSITKISYDFVESLERPYKDRLSEILDSLGIKSFEFLGNILTKQNDTKTFEMLFNSNITADSFNKTLKKMNKTEADLFDFTKPRLLTALRNSNIPVLQKLANDMNFKFSFYKIFHIFNATYDDFMMHDAFKSILVEFENSLNSTVILGVFTSHINIYTHPHMNWAMKDVKDFVNVYANTFSPESFFVEDIDVPNNDFAILTTRKHSTHFINITDKKAYNKTEFNNCFYLIKNETHVNKVKVVNVENKKLTMSVNTSSPGLFQFGSPLICNETLYGLATGMEKERIIFVSFYDAPKPRANSSGRSNVSISFVTFICAVFAINLH